MRRVDGSPFWIGAKRQVRFDNFGICSGPGAGGHLEVRR